MIILKNKGEIDLDCIKIMGVHVKSNDNPIGFFGTGLKYAIAVFLREGIELKMFVGKVEYEFVTEKREILGESFDVCRMVGPFDSVDLNFTTGLGKNWELWQAYRELHSNCLDEDGEIYQSDSYIPQDGYTHFVIPDIDVSGVFLSDYESKPLFSNYNIEIHEGPSYWIYYKGIRAKKLEKPSVYTYNIKSDCSLTEDRLLCYDFEVQYAINNSLASMSEKVIIKDIITDKDNFESTLNINSWCYEKPSEEFIDVFASNYKACSSSVKDYVSKNTPPPQKTEEQLRQQAINDIKNICDDIGFDFQQSGDSISINIEE